ncbi:serine hydrolase domain-containing protein [Caulobacter mirabilis]|uniref:Serine hydrolase n=1 Tax=Caulobacter mirabilis TaxID=69666 RepID=A0A2D2ATG9_9CAUL|nr:serine hydrolase domain-containing protein [Caulobacter mirabilis]ATQ41304.1 serine hydrolase [Caulobacter mirabilis]
MINRRLLLAAGPAVAFGLAGCSREGAGAPSGSLQKILKDTGAPAVAGMVVTAEGVAYLEAAGRRHRGAEDAVTKNDLWHLGSNTKAMTAALYGKLVEDGLARWGATLAELFPDLKLDPAWAKTTIDQVMSHTAGLGDSGYIGRPWLGEARADQRPLEAQRASLIAKALAAPPNGKPGVFEYANMNFVLAGAAIEMLTAEAWETAMRTRLFAPLEMTSAGFGAPLGAQPWGHVRLPLGFGGLIPMDPANKPDNPAAMGPAGNVHTSLTDYAKFLRVFLTDGGGFLKPETVAHLLAPPSGGDYAQGWGVNTKDPWAQGPRYGHEGSNTMWHAVALVAPARKLALVTVSNAFLPEKRNAAYDLLKQLKERFAPA